MCVALCRILPPLPSERSSFCPHFAVSCFCTVKMHHGYHVFSTEWKKKQQKKTCRTTKVDWQQIAGLNEKKKILQRGSVENIWKKQTIGKNDKPALKLTMFFLLLCTLFFSIFKQVWMCPLIWLWQPLQTTLSPWCGVSSRVPSTTTWSRSHRHLASLLRWRPTLKISVV